MSYQFKQEDSMCCRVFGDTFINHLNHQTLSQDDDDRLRLKLGDMVYYKEIDSRFFNEIRESYRTEIDELDTDDKPALDALKDIILQKLYTTFISTIDKEWFEFVSWDKLQDIIFYDTRNSNMVDYKPIKGRKNKINKKIINELNEQILTGEIIISQKLYVLMKVDTSNSKFITTYSTDEAIRHYQTQFKNEYNRVKDDYTDDIFLSNYWGMKVEYLTKKIGNHIICDMTKM